MKNVNVRDVREIGKMLFESPFDRLLESVTNGTDEDYDMWIKCFKECHVMLEEFKIKMLMG